MPPPKPATLDGTEVCDVANGPRLASMLALVGSGPRSNGFSSWAPTGGAPPASTLPAMAIESASVASRRRPVTTEVRMKFPLCGVRHVELILTCQ